MLFSEYWGRLYDDSECYSSVYFPVLAVYVVAWGLFPELAFGCVELAMGVLDWPCHTVMF